MHLWINKSFSKKRTKPATGTRETHKQPNTSRYLYCSSVLAIWWKFYFSSSTFFWWLLSFFLSLSPHQWNQSRLLWKITWDKTDLFADLTQASETLNASRFHSQTCSKPNKHTQACAHGKNFTTYKLQASEISAHKRFTHTGVPKIKALRGTQSEEFFSYFGHINKKITSVLSASASW